MHPTMLYEIAFNVAAALFLWRFRARVPAPGDALKLYLLAAATFRFLVEFIRTSPRQAFDLTAPQWVLDPDGRPAPDPFRAPDTTPRLARPTAAARVRSGAVMTEPQSVTFS